MARQPRLAVAGHPYHVIHRGHDRQPIVRDDDDRETFLAMLDTHARASKVAVHAYVLMDNHVHLLLTPETDAGLPTLMQSLGRSYVRYFNQRHRRSGTLWEGRYRSNLIESERYLLACMVYIDLNPVRAGMVEQAQDYRWSSHRHCTGQNTDRCLSPHPLYWAMGNTPFAREAAYAAFVQAGQDAHQTQALTRAALTGWALGEPEFLQQVQKDTPRRLTPRKAGRPSKYRPNESDPN